MCGFSGIVSTSIIIPSEIISMGESISHRGPDYTGYYFDQYAGFVHNRLSLLDISINGNQPFENEKFVLLFNGEIYNHQKIRNKYLYNQIFISTSDTETLFYLIERYGINFATSQIHGMFSFVWYDKKTFDVSIVRDRLGIKPLFYRIENDGIIFSSEYKSIIQLRDLVPDKALILSSTLGEIEYSRSKTLFSEISQLEPGSILRYSIKGSVKIENYFKLTDLVDKSLYTELHSMKDNDIIDLFDRLINDSVESMLMSDVGMGSFISGGIDSSLVSCIASRKNSISLFTANVVGKYSELDACRIVSNSIGEKLNVYDYESKYFLRDLVRCTWHYEAPINVHASAIPFNCVANLARQLNTKAVLTGEGSDELFLGYPRLLTRKLDRFIKLPYNLIDAIYCRIPGLINYLNIKKNNYANDLLYIPFVASRKADLDEYNESFSFIKRKKLIKEHSLTLEMLGRGLHSLLWRNDRIGMMHSIESRFPFLDEDLMKFAVNLPIRMKIGRSINIHNIKHPFLIDKKIVRVLAKKYVPKGIERIQKKGFIIHGHRSVKISSDFFYNGFLSDLFHLSKRDCAALENKTDNFLLAKLAQVEIWGRLFSRKEKIQEVEKFVANNLSMTI